MAIRLLRLGGTEWLELSLASHHLLAPVKRYNRIYRGRERGRGKERKQVVPMIMYDCDLFVYVLYLIHF